MADYQAGEVILIDKPLKWTSFDVVNKLKWTFKKHFGYKKIKVGHAGTLDPLASGLLIVCTGKKTKSIAEIQNQKKVYTGRFELGAVTPSYDLETEVEAKADPTHLTEVELKEAAAKLTGELEQVPPIFSAKKIKGKRAYDLARDGQKPKMQPKTVFVHSFEIVKVDLPEVYFKIECSKGTYIRSLAHDFGELLEVGAYLKRLRREAIGNYHLKEARSIDALVSELQEQAAEKT